MRMISRIIENIQRPIIQLVVKSEAYKRQFAHHYTRELAYLYIYCTSILAVRRLECVLAGDLCERGCDTEHA